MIDADTASLLTEAVAAFAKPDQARFRAVRNAGAGYDREAWRFLAEQGWIGVSAPEAVGGAALGAGGAAAIARPLGYGIRNEPFTQAVHAIALLESAGSDALQAVAAAIVDGTLIAGVIGDTETPTLAAQALPDGAYRLKGTSILAEPQGADGFVVHAHTASEPGLFWVPAESEGVTREEPVGPDGARFNRLTFDGAIIGADHVVALGADAVSPSRRALDLALITQSTELLGLMDRVLEITLDYLRNRKQFGQPIGSFQALQHRAVDLWMQREITELAIAGAVASFDAGADVERRSALASAAKARAASAAVTGCNQAVQMHGAIGTTDEYELALHLHRALRISTMLGNGFVHRRRYARHAISESGLIPMPVSSGKGGV